MLLDEQTLDRPSAGPANLFTASLGGGLFAFSSNGAPSDHPGLFVVDASNPMNPGTSTTTIPAVVSDLAGQGNVIYTTSSSGLIIYQVEAADPVPVTARVEIPTGTGVSIVPGSFSVEPSQIISGSNEDTLVFNLSLTSASSAATITWQTSVANLGPAEQRRVVNGATLDFTSQGTQGQTLLGPLDVAGNQVLGLDPATRTVAPGQSAVYTLKVSNPTSSDLTYDLAVSGVPSTWSDLPGTVTVAAGGEQDVPFNLVSDVFTPAGDLGFTVTATAGTIAGSVGGDLVLSGSPAQARYGFARDLRFTDSRFGHRRARDHRVLHRASDQHGQFDGNLLADRLAAPRSHRAVRPDGCCGPPWRLQLPGCRFERDARGRDAPRDRRVVGHGRVDDSFR